MTITKSALTQHIEKVLGWSEDGARTLADYLSVVAESNDVEVDNMLHFWYMEFPSWEAMAKHYECSVDECKRTADVVATGRKGTLVVFEG